MGGFEALVEEVEEGLLVFAEAVGLLFVFELFDQAFFGGFDGLGGGGGGEIVFEDGGVDVALAADGGGVAEALGDLLDGFDDVAFGLRGGAGGLVGAEQDAGEDGACPGAEVLGGEVLLGDAAEVLVDVGGVDGVVVALAVEVLEELVAREVFAAADDFGEAAVVEVDGVVDAALALKGKGDVGAFDFDVLGAHGGEAVGLVFAGVLDVADADEGSFHEADDGGEDLFAGEAGEGEIVVDLLADAGEGLAEEGHALVLGFVAGFAPAWVVAALLASAGVAAGGLEVAVGVGADPDVGPGGRDDEALNAAEDFGIADGFAVRIDVAEGGAGALAADAGAGVGDVAEACGFGGGDGIEDGFRRGSCFLLAGATDEGSCGRHGSSDAGRRGAVLPVWEWMGETVREGSGRPRSFDGAEVVVAELALEEDRTGSRNSCTVRGSGLRVRGNDG